MTNRTVANTPILNYVKRTYNEKIYATARKTYNSDGKAAMIEYLTQFVRAELQDALRTKLQAM